MNGLNLSCSKIFACIFFIFATSAVKAEVCTTPERLTERTLAPCYTGATVPPLYGPWLKKCQGERDSDLGYYPQFEKQLLDSVESRLSELTLGSDRAWDKTLDGPASTTFLTACDLSQNPQESSINRNNQDCGSLPVLTDTSSGITYAMKVDEPAGKTLAFKSYRLGAWIHSMRQITREIISEVKGSNSLSISPVCKETRDYMADKLQSLGPRSFALQPNIEAIENDKDPCPSAAFGAIPELEQFRLSGHYNPEIVRNRISGCLMIAARKQIEAAFIQLAACEVRARATTVDKEFFIAGSCPSPISKKTDRSVFSQLIEEQVLKGKCETSAYNSCTDAVNGSCTKDPNFDLNEPGCWTCLSAKMQDCFKVELPKFLTSSAAPPTGLQVSLASQSLPENFRALSSLTPASSNRGITYSFTTDGCTDTKMSTPSCPNTASTLMLQGVSYALDILNQVITTSVDSGTESPLQSSFDLDSSKDNLLFNRATEMPLDGIDPVYIFPTSPVSPLSK